MTPVEIQYSLEAITVTLRKYGDLSGKSEEDIIAKQSTKLGYNIRAGLKALMPAKGSIRADALEALASGRGVKVRPAVYDKLHEKLGADFSSLEQSFKGPNQELAGTGFKAKRTMNFQALAVQAEIGLRESGRGFMSYSTPRSRSFAELQAIGESSQVFYDRYQRLLSSLALDVRPESAYKFARFTWPENSSALEGITHEQQMNVLRKAIDDTNADIMVYVNRKLEENKQQAGL